MLLRLLLFLSADTWKSRCVIISKTYGEWITSLLRIYRIYFFKLDCSAFQLSLCYILYSLLAFRVFEKEFIFIQQFPYCWFIVLSSVCNSHFFWNFQLLSCAFSVFTEFSMDFIYRCRYFMSRLTSPFCKTVSYRTRTLFAYNPIKINIPHLYILAIPCFKALKKRNLKALLPFTNF